MIEKILIKTKNKQNVLENLNILEGLTTGIIKFKKYNANNKMEFIEIPCAVARDDNTVVRLIDQKGLFSAFARNSHGAQRVPGLPSVIGSKTLASLIPDNELSLLKPIKYRYGKTISTGYNSEALLVIVRAYMKAEELNILRAQQIPALKQAKNILLDLAGQRIRDIIDKATGYINDEEITVLDSLIKQIYLNDEPLRRIAQRFPGEFYQEIFRLHGWKFNSKSAKRPSYVGKFTNDYVYNLIPDTVMKEIRNRNPIMKDRDYNYRKDKYYHYLTTDTGIKELDDIIKSIIKVMRLSKDKDDFKRNYKIAFADELNNKNFVRPLQLVTSSKYCSIE